MTRDKVVSVFHDEKNTYFHDNLIDQIRKVNLHPITIVWMQHVSYFEHIEKPYTKKDFRTKYLQDSEGMENEPNWTAEKLHENYNKVLDMKIFKETRIKGRLHVVKGKNFHNIMTM